MSTTAEDIRKIMNIAPFATPFSETFVPATHSLEAIRGAIDALEAGIFGYGVVAGAQIVEIDDKAEYAVELLNPGGAVIPAGSITPGTYTIHRIRDGTKTSIYTHAAAAADGRVELDTPYEYLIASWAPGDLFMVVFSGIYTTIGATLTYFPDMILSGRIARDEEIEDILEYTTAATLKDAIEDDTDSAYNRIGDPTGRTNYKSLYAMLELDDTANYNLDDILRTGYATAGADLGTGSIMERIGTTANALHNKSVLEGMGLPNTDLTTLYELLVIGYTTAGANLGTGSIMERIGTIGNVAHNRSVLEGMGLPDTDLTTLYELMVTGFTTAGANLGTGSIMERIGTIGNAAHNRSVLEGMGLPNLDLTTLYELMVTGYATAGADLGTGSIMERIGTTANALHNKSVLEGMGLPNTDLTTLYELMVDGYATEGDAAKAGAIIEKLNYAFDRIEDDADSVLGRIGAFDGGADAQGDIFQAIDPPADGHGIMTVLGKDDEDPTKATWDTDHWEGTVLARLQKALLVLVNNTGSEIGANLSIIDLIGAFDGGADPQGDIYQALGVPVTASIWDAVQYIEDVACPAAPVAGSLLQVLVEDIYERTLGETTLEGLLGVADVAGRSIIGNLGDFQARATAAEKTLLAVLGIPDDVNGSLYARLGAYTTAAPLKTTVDSIEVDTKYINDVACPAAPVAGSLLQVLVEDIYERTLGEQTLNGLLGVADVAGRSIIGNLGDFQARATAPEVTLMDVLGIPDDANGSLYTRLGAYTAAAPLKTSVDQIETDTDPLVAGKMQTAIKTLDLNTAVVGLNDLFTGTAQTVIIEKLIIKMPDVVGAAPMTGITIQTDHTTPQQFITAAQGAVANMTAQNQFFSTDPISLEAGKKAQLTLAGGNHAAAYLCTIEALYRAVTSGGSLA